MKNRKKFQLLHLLTGALAMFQPIPVGAASLMDYFRDSARRTGRAIGLPGSEIDNVTQADVLGRIGIIINALLVFLGVIFFILIIYGGFLWMTSAGNDSKVDKAKRIIVASIIGLGIVLLGQVITFIVIELF